MVSTSPYGGRPFIIAHRGLPLEAPENTLASFQLALDSGADRVECDTRLSKDGVPVVIHDQSLHRTTGVRKKVGQLRLDELKKLDAGRWKNERFRGEPIPTLCEVLELVERRARLFIEVKESSMAKEVVKAIRKVGVEPTNLVIFSKYYEVIEDIGRMEPSLPSAWLLLHPPSSLEEKRRVIQKGVKAGTSGFGLPRRQVDPKFVQLAQERGFLIYVWTVNDPKDAGVLSQRGVDGIVSDQPRLLMETLTSRTP
jgi:glycerophosphoryl diester phosphodiesterase